jgi:hypothetical protein
MEMNQRETCEVILQKDGTYQVIIRRPSAVAAHVSDFRTAAEAEAWVVVRRAKLQQSPRRP